MSLRRRNVLAFGVLLLGIFLLLSSPTVYAASQTFAYMNITNTTLGATYPSENITFMENNWIKLHKEVEVDIPGLTFIYNGFNTAGPYSKDGRTIEITVNVTKDTDHKVHYPFKKHQFFYNTSTVYATLETDLTGTYHYYIASTSPTQVKRIVEMLVDGNTTEFRSLFLGGINGTLNANEKKTIETLAAGDYLMIVTDKDNPLGTSPDFRIIAVTGIEVLDYKSELTAPPHPVRRGDDLEVTMKLTGAPSADYRYGGALIREKDYVKSHEIKLVSPATKDGTNITFDGVSFVENWKIMGVGLTNINAATINTKISEILSAGGYNGAVNPGHITTQTNQNLTFTTDDLPLGTYILSVGVWQTGSNRLVAFAQTKIVVASERAVGKVATGAETGTVTAGSVSFTEPVINETLKSIRFTNISLTGTINVSSYDKDNNPSTVTPDVTKIKTPVGYLIIEVPPGWENEPAYIDFNVSLADLSAARPRIDKTEVKLYKLVDSTWVALPTTYNGDVDGYATYTAHVTSWSIFAIAAAQPAAAPTPTPTPVVTPTLPPPVTPTPTPAPPFPVVPLVAVIAIVIVVILVAVAFVVLRRKK